MTRAAKNLDLSALSPSSRRELMDFYQFLLQRRVSTRKVKPSKKSFSELCGGLTWKGDAVAVQRNMRDEW
jgi:hypothetical protein